jgi:hypothetical protein
MLQDGLPVPLLTSQAVQEGLHFSLKMGPIVSLETSVTYLTKHAGNISEERRPKTEDLIYTATEA